MTLTLPVRLDPYSAPDETLHVTAGGWAARINVTGTGGGKPVHGAVFIGGEWIPRAWTSDGFFHHPGVDSPFDLRDRPKAKRGWWVAVLERHQFARIFRSEEEAREKVAAMKSKLLALTYLEEGDGLDTPADPSLWVDWAKLPNWVQWAAADEDGEVWGYDKEPEKVGRSWHVGGEYQCLEIRSPLYRLAPGFDWRKTLTPRPESV